MESEVADITGFFSTPYASTEGTKPSTSDVDTMPPMQATGMVGGNTLDEIIMQNNKEMERRRSVQEQLFVTDATEQVDGLRRGSMIEFGNAGSGELNGFHFGPSAAHGRNRGILCEAAAVRGGEVRRRSMGNIDLSSHYANLGADFATMSPSTPFQPRLHIQNLMNLSVPQSYIGSSSASVPANAMLMDFEPDSAGHSTGNLTPINLFAQQGLHQSPQDALASPMHQSFGSQNGQDRDRRDRSLGSASGILGELSSPDTLSDVTGISVAEQVHGLQSTIPLADVSAQEPGSAISMQDSMPNMHETMEGRTENAIIPAPTIDGLQSVYGKQRQRQLCGPVPPLRSSYDGVYSSSGFDMMAVLMKVATRPNPQINIGAVDMSCAFVVSDVTKHDMPILYCSEVFERLTGYTKHEILGRNCRFLQAPDGKVQGGVPRKYVDDDTVYYLKNKIEAYQEAQTSLINYRKGGQPFMNLLTMIPITWDSDKIKFVVGFQVDLVEQPGSVSNKNPNGSYLINYQRGYLPRYVLPDLPRHEQVSEPGYTVNRDDVSTALTTISTGESEFSKRIWDKVLLENTDDVVHVLSLKGLFLYLSPSCRKVLEYDAQELVGTALSSICHPSDIVPVTRELKDSSLGSSVSVVFRIRRKHSGYTWFESHGSLHTEQGKGRKCIILVGRERPVYVLSKKDVLVNGGIGENELWTKMSTSGMFLFVSYTSKILLDKLPEDLVGTSIQALMRPDSRIEFGGALELARTGKQAQFKHELISKRGQVLQAQTVIYPGDASEGQKPTFFVAQTRMLKPNRSVPMPGGAKGVLKPQQQASGGSSSSTMSGSSPNRFSTRPANSPTEVAVTVTGSNGLPIGSQDVAMASEENFFDELKTTRSTSWQFELRQMEKRNRLLVEELQSLLQSRKKRKRGRGAAQLQKDCANCHTRVTPEWRRGPSGKRDLCNSCGLRWAKQNGRVSPRTNSDKSDMSPTGPSPLTLDSTTRQQQSSSSMPPPADKRALIEPSSRLSQTPKSLPLKLVPGSPASRNKGEPNTAGVDRQQQQRRDGKGRDEITQVSSS
ncbi:MAG: blue light receptor [Geoglossum umbratile]|nr:MAG: blue light receptor [Geoglossum umbratile]